MWKEYNVTFTRELIAASLLQAGLRSIDKQSFLDSPCPRDEDLFSDIVTNIELVQLLVKMRAEAHRRDLRCRLSHDSHRLWLYYARSGAHIITGTQRRKKRKRKQLLRRKNIA